MNNAEAQELDATMWTALASRMMVATADAPNNPVDEGIGTILSLLRSHLKMDAVFVSQFTQGRRVFRHVDVSAEQPVIAVGDSSPLEQSWCQRVVDGRIPQLIRDVASLPDKDELPAVPFGVGTHISTPVFSNDGRLFGTLCAFSFSPVETIQQNDLTNLKAVAAVLSNHLRDPVC